MPNHWTIFESSDHDHVAEWESSFGLDMDRIRLDTGRGSYRFASVQVGAITLWKEFEPSTVLADYAHAEGVVEFTIGTNNQTGATWCGKKLHDSSLVLHQGSKSYTSKIQPGSTMYGFVLPKDLLNSYLDNDDLLAQIDASRQPLLPQLGTTGLQLLRFADWIIESAVDRSSMIDDWWIDQEAILSRLLTILDQSTKLPHASDDWPVMKWWHLVENAKYLIDGRIKRKFTASEIAQELGISRRLLEKAFQSVIGISPYQYILIRKLHEARRLLQQHELAVLDVAMELSFSNPSRMAKWYRDLFGELPSQTASRL